MHGAREGVRAVCLSVCLGFFSLPVYSPTSLPASMPACLRACVRQLLHTFAYLRACVGLVGGAYIVCLSVFPPSLPLS